MAFRFQFEIAEAASRPKLPIKPPPSGISAGLCELHRKFGGKCQHCDADTVLGHPHVDLAATRDHLIPRSKGGGGGENIILSCLKCNNDKGDKMPGEFVPVAQRSEPAFHRSRVLGSSPSRHTKRRLSAAETVGYLLECAAKAEYPNDPKAQAAFMAVYRTRLHLLTPSQP